MIKNRLQSTEHRQQSKDYMIQNSVCRAQKNVLGSENGFVLVLTLLLLLVATVVGITALSTSTTNVMIAGNQRLSELNFAAADSGVLVSVPIIKNTAFFGEVSQLYSTGTDPLVSNPTDLRDEILGATIADCPNPSASCTTITNPPWAPDIEFPLSDIKTYIDVDYLYAAPNEGGAIEYASGYDGLGHGAGAGGIGIYYAVTSVGQGMVGSETLVNAIYRYITQ